MIHKDPFMLVSWINTQLRDHYQSLKELCQAFELEQKAIEASLAEIDFFYDSKHNRFT